MIERERRFLVNCDRLPALTDGDLIEQGYLVADGNITVRVRRRSPIALAVAASSIETDTDLTEGHWTMTVKAPLGIGREQLGEAPLSGSERREVEIALGQEQASELWGICGDQIVSKTRFLIPIDRGLVAEVDIFSGRWAGLMMVEVEFGDRIQMAGFLPPVWFGSEVTSDPRFTNAGLALAAPHKEAELRGIYEAECGTGA